MAKFLGIGFLVLVSVAGWQIGGMLNPQSLGMVLGIIFGMMAGIPAALIALTASRVQPNVTNNYITVKQESAPVAKLPVRESDVILIPSNQKRIGVKR